MLKWPRETAAKRISLGMNHEDEPWTSRPNIRLRGLPAQLQAHNFQNELLNIRWVEFCKECFLDPVVDSPPDGDCKTDVRQSFKHQLKRGTACLAGKSKIYVHGVDRTLACEEHLTNQGWSADDVQTSNCHEVYEDLFDPATRRARAHSEDAMEGRRRIQADRRAKGKATTPRD